MNVQESYETLYDIFHKIGRTDLIEKITQKKLHKAIIKMVEEDPKTIKKPYKDEWTTEHPTTGCCYFVHEVLYHLLRPLAKPYIAKTGENKTHRYLKLKDKEIIDLTADQFNEDEFVSYLDGKHRNFMTPKPSKRARRLAELLGLQ